MTGTDLGSPSGLEHLPQAVAGYRIVLANNAREGAMQAIGRLTASVPAGESVVAVAQAKRRDSGNKRNVLLVMTHSKLLVIDEAYPSGAAESFDLDALRLIDWDQDTWFGT